MHVPATASAGCSQSLAEGNELTFFLMTTSSASIFNIALHPSFDGYAPPSSIDVVGLRQSAYAHGMMPAGRVCPEDCITGSVWSEWGSCSETCGLGVVTRYLETRPNAARGGINCPSVVETARCNVKPCNIVYDPADNSNKWRETYMLIGKCQTTRPIRHLLCTEICPAGEENLPVSWTVRPERVICNGSTVKFRAVMITEECACKKVAVDDGPLFFFLGK